jgi:hypothetical protein
MNRFISVIPSVQQPGIPFLAVYVQTNTIARDVMVFVLWHIQQ